jgi:hypothetical protein
VISEYGEGYGGTRALAYRLTLPFRRGNEKDGDECNFLPTGYIELFAACRRAYLVFILRPYRS